MVSGAASRAALQRTRQTVDAGPSRLRVTSRTVRSKNSKPSFDGVVDLGLRDVGVENQTRRLAVHSAKSIAKLYPLLILSVTVACVVIREVGARAVLVPTFALLWTAGFIALTARMARRTPMRVVKVSAEGANQAAWMMVGAAVLLAILAVVAANPLTIPIVALMSLLALLVWRGRGKVPEVLRRFRPVLAADEAVLGDGAGALPGSRRWNEAFRLVVATDRRLLVATPQPDERFLLIDVPYSRVTRFGIEWKYLGRFGELSLTVAGPEGAAPETHVIANITPANLLSIARALRQHGVPVDDPDDLDEAERLWETARLRNTPGQRRRLWRRAEPPSAGPVQQTVDQPAEPVPAPAAPEPRPLFDPAAMNTPEFDRGLWVLLGAGALTFYLNPFGIGIGVSRNSTVAILLIVPVICGVCAYVSRTKSSLAYLVPLNLFVSPAFFFTDANVVITIMLLLSAAAAAGLWAGSALQARSADPAAPKPSAAPRAERGSLRYTLSAQGLIRLSTMMLATLVSLVAVTSAAGFELMALRLAIEERTGTQVPVDGRSNLTGNSASLTYTAGPDLHEFITDTHAGPAPNDGARWELRSSFTKGYNVISLAHYVFEPQLDQPAALEDFLARKDDQHAGLAGHEVHHTVRYVDGRKGYMWEHGSMSGRWFYAAWFPQKVHTVRVECIARKQKARFKRLCAEAVRTLKFRRP